MKKRTVVSICVILALVLVLVLCSLFVRGPQTHECHACDGTGLVDDVVCEDCSGSGVVESESLYSESFIALLPPLLAIVLALITKEVYSSLFVGVIVGGLLFANYHPLSSMDSVINGGIISAIADNAGIFAFLVLLGILVALVNKAGGSAAFGAWAQKHIKSRVGALLSTFLLGVLIFIDDYFNCLTVGSVMRPVTDRHRISRSKLAYLIDATAAPICMIAPISSWAAAVSSYAEEGQGLRLFISAIPFNFYSILTLIFIIAITLMKFDYGPMKLHENNAVEKGDLFTSGERVEETEETVSSKGRVIDLVLPILFMIGICVYALLYIGGIHDGLGFVDAFSETDATVGLPWGALIALVFAIVYLLLRRVITFKDAMECVPSGFKAMVPAILILTLATSLKNMTSMLGAKYFVKGVMEGAAAGLNMFLPAIIFLVALVLSFSTGTSWGTFGILIPIVTAIFPDSSTLMIIGISACLAGSVCGDHCSPISDTTIMSSAGAQCNHLNHVSTQLPYALTVAAVSFVGFIVAGLSESIWLSLGVSVILLLGVLFVIRSLSAKKTSA